MKKRFKLIPLLLGGALVLSGCDNFSPNWPMKSPSPEEMSIDTPWVDYIIPATEIAFKKGETNLDLRKGDTHQFSFTVEPRDATLSALTWESDNPNVATVSNSGLLTAVGGGKANISLSSGDVKARALVTVTVPIENFVVTNNALDLDLYEEVQLNTTFSPEDTTQKGLSYEATGTGFTVSETGLVKAEAEGSGEIRVTNEALNKVEIVTVNISDKYNYISSFTLDGPDTIEVTKAGQLSYEIVGINPEVPASTLKNNSVSYAVKEGSEDLISVDANTGAFSAKEPGHATIIGSIYDERNKNTLTDEIEIEIFEVSATAISLDKTGTIELDNKDNSECQLTATYTLSDPSYEEPSRGHLEYISTDSSVAKVDDTGLITAVGLGANGSGKTTITVRDTKYNVSASVDVHTTIYAKTIQITESGPFYLDEKVVITANVNPVKTSDNLVWVYDDTTGHTFEEDGNKLTITCNNLTEPVQVHAYVGSGDNKVESNLIELTPVEREVDFEYGKVYIVGSANYKTSVSKDAGAEGSWQKAKYAYIMSDKTGHPTAKYEYKATIEFRENDLWKIRRNVTDWCDTECYTKDHEVNYKIGYYKTTVGAFAAGQMGVTADDNIIVKQPGKYDIYYAFYENENPEGWFEVYVEEHGMKLSSKSVHAKLTSPDPTVSKITASAYEGTLEAKEVDDSFISVAIDQLTGVISITPVALGETSFKVCDSVKEITVTVEIKEGSSAPSTSLYIRGSAANGWSDVSEDYVLKESEDTNNIGEILDVYLSEGDFKIANTDWSEEYGWDYDNRSTIAGKAAAKFSAGASDNNIRCNVAGYYNIYLTVNHYIFIDSVGGDDPATQSIYYVRGSAVGSWDALPANQMQTDSNPNNVAIIEGIHLDVGEFKIANADWSKEFGWDYDSRSTIIGGAKDNFAAGTSDNNIKCNVAGDYNLYLTVDNYISVELASVDPNFAITPTSATIESGESTVVTALNVTGDLAYSVTEGSASVIIDGSTATISSTNVGVNLISFSDESEADPIVFTLTVTAPVEKTRQYIETKSWFNDGGEGEHVYVYAFKEGSSPMQENKPFPGEDATWVKDLKDGKKLFYYDIAETFDTFIVSNGTYQTEDISIYSLSGDNCIYLNAEEGSSAIPVGHYPYSITLSSNAGTIESGESTNVTIDRYIGDITPVVTPTDSASVSITDDVATISSSTVGESVITFTDELGNSAVYTLTVETPSAKIRQYIETKSWFNDGGEDQHVYVYAFKEGSDPMQQNAPFPGVDATWVKDLDSDKKLFYYDISEKFDTFVVSNGTYQTEDIAISSLEGDNCIYLDADAGSSAIPVGHYDYSLKLSANSGTITTGGSTSVTFDRYIGEVTYEVSPEDSATVSITGGTATISSSTVGTSTITFTDGAGKEAVYTLTVNEAPDPSTTKMVYLQTKGFFNNGSSNQDVKVYCWNSENTSINNGWPGQSAQWVEDLHGSDEGKKIFSFEFDLTKYDSLIFVQIVDGNPVFQTVDINIASFGSDDTVYLNADNWTDASTPIPVGFYTR